jgi:hypothetical protein
VERLLCGAPARRYLSRVAFLDCVMFRIGIFHPFGNLDSVPCLVSTITLLGQAGYEVDVFTNIATGPESAAFDSEQIALLPAKAPGRRQRPMALRLLSSNQYRFLQLQRRHRKSAYVAMIGVDPQGLIQAGYWAKRLNVALVYFSLELLLSYELRRPEDLANKKKEQILLKSAAFSIALGQERADALARDNNLGPDQVISVPNATLEPPRRQRSTYLLDRYALHGNDTRIVLVAGELSPLVGLTELAVSVREWPDNWVLICHSRRVTHDWQKWYFDALKAIVPEGRIHFSLEPIPREHFPELVRSADVGVIFYMPSDNGRPTDNDNMRLIGRSSGKLSYLLQNGIPVLVNKIPSHEALVQSYGCGMVCSDPSDTRANLAAIFRDHDTFCENALACFKSEYDFESSFGQVLQRLKALS